MSMFRIGNYPGASCERKVVDSHLKVFTFLKKIFLFQILVVFIEFSLVKSVFVANIQFFQQDLIESFNIFATNSLMVGRISCVFLN